MHNRRDVFDDPDNMPEFKALHGYDLAPPKTWMEFGEIGQFFSDKFAPGTYGAGMFRQPSVAKYLFEEQFRVDGGRFFDPETGRAAPMY